ncbi:MAG: RHS repeat-associated core domain-containing protein [Fimbriimonadaceae bacterium]|nr:RHS repeat-associated core domain-containing protein [Fimbriimonadaceae bacterium]
MKPRLRSRFERDSTGDADKLTQITYPSTATNTFTYNGLDTRVGKVDSAGTATYKRDGDYVTAPVLDDGAAKFTPGISERRGTTSRFSHPDRMGSVTRQTSASQGSAASRQYDAFGNVAAVSGTWTGPFGFAGNWGYQEDGDSGLQLLGHRYYDPSTGRFLTRDPIKDGRNWYTYCENNPLTGVDPTGLFLPAIAIAVIIVLVIIVIAVAIHHFMNQPKDEQNVTASAIEGFGPIMTQAPTGASEAVGGADALMRGGKLMIQHRMRTDAHTDAIDDPNGSAGAAADGYERGTPVKIDDENWGLPGYRK